MRRRTITIEMSTRIFVVQNTSYIAQPVYPNGNANSLGPNIWRKDFGMNNPVNKANAKGKIADVSPHCSGPTSISVAGPRDLVHHVQFGHYELGDTHADGSRKETLSATLTIHKHDYRDRTEKVQETDDTSC